MSDRPGGATFRVHSVEPAVFGKGTVIVQLMTERGSFTEGDDGLGYVVRLTVDEQPVLLAALLDAYRNAVQTALVDLAAGGCRTCGNRRRVGTNPLAGLLGGDEGGTPCPTCIPRAERRLRDRLSFRKASR